MPRKKRLEATGGFAVEFTMCWVLTLSHIQFNMKQTTVYTHLGENMENRYGWTNINKVVNIAAKGDIAHFEQFLLLSNIYQKLSGA